MPKGNDFIKEDRTKENAHKRKGEKKDTEAE